jgi:chemotaxis protein methyltransferase CheR
MGLSDAEFRSLSARIAETVGIHIATEKRWLLAARVKARLASTGDPDESRYVERVLEEEGSEELGQLVEALRVGETQFYRHAGQLRVIERVALPEIVARRERDEIRTIRVWSAGCASGEEPYTMAMLLDSFLESHPRVGFEILATDLSHTAIDFASRGRYPKGAIRNVPAAEAKSAFSVEGEEVVVRPRLRSRVKFEKRNLLSTPYPRGFDLVLCRNVLIYFGKSTQREVVGRLCRAVLPGGYVALGYSERLDEGDGELLPLRTPDGVLYRRADGTNRVVLPAEPKPPPHRRSSRPPRRRSSRPAPPIRKPIEPTKVPIAAPLPRAVRAAPKAPDHAPTPAEPPEPPQLDGALEGAEGARVARAALAPIVAGVEEPTLSLAGLTFADAEVFRVIARAGAAVAATGEVLRIVGASPSMRHHLTRHRVVPPAVFDEEDGR